MILFKNISGCVLCFGKMSRLTLYLKMRVYHMIIHAFGKAQGPTSTGDLLDEYFKNIFECSHKPQNYQQHVVYIVNADFQVLSEFMVPVT